LSKSKGNHGIVRILYPQGKKSDKKGKNGTDYQRDKYGEQKITHGSFCLSNIDSYPIGSNAKEQSVSEGYNPCVAQKNIIAHSINAHAEYQNQQVKGGTSCNKRHNCQDQNDDKLHQPVGIEKSWNAGCSCF